MNENDEEQDDGGDYESLARDPRVDEIMQRNHCDRATAVEMLSIMLGGPGDCIDDE